MFGLFKGFRASLDLSSSNRNDDIAEIITIKGCYRMHEDLYNSNTIVAKNVAPTTGFKKITPDMVKLPKKTSVATPQREPNNTIQINIPAIVIETDTPKPELKNIKEMKLSKKEEKDMRKAEKERIKNEKKKQDEELAKNKKMKDKEKSKKETEGKKAKPKSLNPLAVEEVPPPLPKTPPPEKIEYDDNLTSLASAPPPYEEQNTITSESDPSGNISFGNKVGESSWGFVSQHRNALKRPNVTKKVVTPMTGRPSVYV